MEKFHSIKEVSALLGLHVSTVWRYIQDGRLHAHKLGGFTYRISDEALQNFINGAEFSALTEKGS
jgi:excisionase family DNA binding protein